MNFLGKCPDEYILSEQGNFTGTTPKPPIEVMDGKNMLMKILGKIFIQKMEKNQHGINQKM